MVYHFITSENQEFVDKKKTKYVYKAYFDNRNG